MTSKSFRQLSTITSAWLFFLIFMGAVVRVIDSSAACSSWPLCNNLFVSPLQLSAWIEFSHRMVAGIAALLVITVAMIAWRSYRHYHFILGAALGMVAFMIIQIFLGGAILWTDNPALVSAAHLLGALLALGASLFLTTVTYLPKEDMTQIGISSRNHSFYFRSILLAGLGFLLLLITGTLVTGTGTAFACSGWPLCQGEIFPVNFNLEIAINLLHRFTVVLVGVLIAAVVLQTRRRYTGYRLLNNWTTTLGLLFLIQMGMGGLYSLTTLPHIISVIHLGLTTTIWGCLIVLATICYMTVESVMPPSEDEETLATPLPVKQRAATFFKLTKPWILILLLITTITAMFIAAEGLPSISLILYTLLGGALSAGGASTLNSYIDSDIDQMMSRTSRRATVTGLVTPQETLLFGLTLSTLSFLIFAIFVNMLSAVLSTIGIIYYVFFYTLYLKRTTIHNIIIGGAAGAIPPLVGWTAVTNNLDLGAFYLFAIIFFWTPPHTWALALLVKKDYAQARVPMLPVVVGEKETTYQILLYSILLITLTLLPFTFNMLSWVYLIVAAALGSHFIYLAWKLWRNYNKSLSKRLYKFSQAYLALLFLLMALDRSLF